MTRRLLLALLLGMGGCDHVLPPEPPRMGQDFDGDALVADLNIYCSQHRLREACLDGAAEMARLMQRELFKEARPE